MFNVAQKLWIGTRSEKENLSFFGKCSNENWLGHNNTLYVTAKEQLNPIVGFVCNAKKLGVIIKNVITDILDYSNIYLNIDSVSKGMLLTTENMAVLIWQQLEIYIEGCNLHGIKLQKTDSTFVEYFDKN